MKTLAVIGVGRWGKNIVNTLEKIPNAGLKYLCADNPEHLEPYSEKYDRVSNWHTLLAKKDLDGVLVATPAKTHAEIATSFLEHGLAVFTEKPMVISSSEADKLKSVVKKSGGVFMVGYQYIFNDYINLVKKEIEAGGFGKIISVESEQIMIPPRADIDVFWDDAPHPLSIFQYLFNPTKLISTEGNIERDSAKVKVQFENAPTLEIIASCFGDKKIRKLTIVGENATAILDETLAENKLAITKNGITSYPKIIAQESLRNELEHFLHCLETGERPLTNVDFGCLITKWLETISKNLRR